MTDRTTDRSTVVVGMSGGVDSSVAAALLVEQGYSVIGVTMKTYDFDRVGGNQGNETSCCGLDAFNDARMVAVKLGIPHYVVDFTEPFDREVIRNFVAEYLTGRTPNPCVICNRVIKWGVLMEKASALGADFIATGHYARTGFDHETGRYFISRPADGRKDQTYALWGLSQAALARTMFPLGELTKPEVRAIAARLGLKTAEKEESFEICFVPDNDYRRFIHERVPDLSGRLAGGPIIREGRKVGEHPGYVNYTVGQRSGVGAHGERAYVKDIDAASNTVTIGRGADLMAGALVAKDLNLVGIREIPQGMRVDAAIRYKDVPSPATVYPLAGGGFRVVFDHPKRAIAPGQSVVLYLDEKLIGGGVIERAED
jgi:tRNA-uridine 2-sulfurtransferase